MKTRQQIFNNGIRHIAKHGYGYSDNQGCIYRGNSLRSSMMRCAIGANIPNDKYSANLEGKSADHNLVREAAGIRADDMMFAQRFQAFHDNAARGETPLSVFLANAEHFAMQEGLKWTPVATS